jgi:hypothetical protein
MYIWSSSIRNSTRVELSSLKAHTEVTTRTVLVSGSVTRFRTTAMRHSPDAWIISTSFGSSSLILCEYSTRLPRLGEVSRVDQIYMKDDMVMSAGFLHITQGSCIAKSFLLESFFLTRRSRAPVELHQIRLR